jgi:hypothetical protein
MKTLAAFSLGAGLCLAGCGLDLRTGVKVDSVADAGARDANDASGSPDDGSTAGSDAASGQDATAVDAAPAAPSTFLPTMTVTIDGVRKGFRLSALRTESSDPTVIRMEFSTGARQLGVEATPGEYYSEVWFEISTGGMPLGGSYACVPAGASTSSLPGVAFAWSFNHPTGNNYSTSGGPCAVNFTEFGMNVGDRIRGTFSAFLDGGHVLTDGVFDLVVPTRIPIDGVT